MRKTVPSPRCDDPLGIGSWRADDDSSRREKQSTLAVHTPDLGRGNSGEPRPAGPPGSAPPWNENEDGVPSSKGELGALFASTRSRNVLQEAWEEVTTQGSNAISKATFILVHVEVHRRVDRAESTTHPSSGAGSCDSRSEAEMNWAASSKGRTVMDFQQFQQACLAMAKGLGVTADASRYGVFCGVVFEASRAVGKQLQVDRPLTRPAREGLSSPGAMPPDSPLRGSFPAGFDETSGPVESGRWLLRSARPAEQKREREQGRNETREAAEPEQGLFADDPQPAQQRHQQQLTRSAEKAAATSGIGSVPPRARVTAVGGGGGGGGGEKSAAVSATGDAAWGDRAVVVMRRAESCRSWPPAWVKQSTPAAAAGQDTGDGGGNTGAIVLARGLLAATSPPRTAATAGPQIRPLDSRLLMGSVSQKALLLQEELRNDRARLLELQRHSNRGHTAWLPCGTSPPRPRSPPASPPREDRDGKQPAVRRSVTAGVGAGGSGGDYCGTPSIDTSGHPQHPRPRLASAAPRLVGGGVVTATSAATGAADAAETTAPPPDALSCAVLGYRFSSGSGETVAPGRAGEWGGAAAAAAAAEDGAESLWGGSIEGSLSTGSLSSGTGRSGFASRAPNVWQHQVVPPKEKVIILPCRLCRTIESALWCAECKMPFCASCFAKVPHHQGTGLFVHDAARDSSSRPQGGSSLPGSTAASRRVERTGKWDPDPVSSARHPPPKQQQQQHEREPSPFTPLGRLRRARPRSLLLPARKSTPELSAMEMEGLRTGAKKGRRKSRRASALLEEKRGLPVAVLPQDELAAFRSIPALCLNSGSDGLCSARDFHNNKYALAAAKAVSPRGLPLDFSRGKGRYNCCGGSLKDDHDDVDGTAAAVGGVKGVKTFGGTSVRIVVQ